MGLFSLFKSKPQPFESVLNDAFAAAIESNYPQFRSEVQAVLSDPEFALLDRETRSESAYEVRAKYINSIVATLQREFFTHNKEAELRFGMAMAFPASAGVPDDAVPSIQLFYCLFHYALTGKPVKWDDARRWEDLWAMYVRKAIQ